MMILMNSFTQFNYDAFVYASKILTILKKSIYLTSFKSYTLYTLYMSDTIRLYKCCTSKT